MRSAKVRKSPGDFPDGMVVVLFGISFIKSLDHDNSPSVGGGGGHLTTILVIEAVALAPLM